MNRAHRSPFASLGDPGPFDRLEEIGRGPIGHRELLEFAAACSYPTFVDERGYQIAGKAGWNEAPFTYAIDRRQAFEFLQAIGRQRGPQR